MAPPAASSYGRPMTNAPPRSDTAPRSVTVLGATGSIGTSTVDLLRRDPERYRVEALSANKRAGELAQLARDLGARFAAVADPAAYRDLKDCLGASGIEAAAGEDAVIEAARRPALGAAHARGHAHREHGPLHRPHAAAQSQLANGRGDHRGPQAPRPGRPRAVRLRALSSRNDERVRVQPSVSGEFAVSATGGVPPGTPQVG